MKITVIGCGRWGSMIAYYLDSIGHDVTLYGRDSSANMRRFISERRNDLIVLPDSIRLSTELKAISESEAIVISINSQGLQSLMEELAPLGLASKIFILCMKGIEITTGRRLSEVVSDNTDFSNRVAVWLGPGHVQEFYRGIPNCMVIDSDDDELKRYLIDEFASKLIRFYYGCDLIGNEIGAAAKNIIGIAAGMLDGLDLSTLKGALMTRGTFEVSRLIAAMGGNPFSAYGLCHLGDYEATVFSQFSHNRRFGEAFVKNENYTELAEGYYTAEAIHRLCCRNGVEMPICSAVHDILYSGLDARLALDALLNRKLKDEFWHFPPG